jgi:DNA-binding SARP family transcriptional activator/DNA-binding XRE family transcriptional regulator
MYRRTAGITQQDFADMAKVSVGMIRDLEQGRTVRPHRGSIDKIADVLSCSGIDIKAVSNSPYPPFADREAGPYSPRDALFSGTDELSIQVLGPLTVHRGGRPLALGGQRQRVLLGFLALRANHWIHRDVLSDVLWPEGPPESAPSLVQAYVTRLGRLLRVQGRRNQEAGIELVRRGNSYSLQSGNDDIDLLAFEGMYRGARQAREMGDCERAAELYEEALALWQADPLCDLDVLRDSSLLEFLLRRWATVVVEFAETCFSQRQYRRALDQIESLVQRDPLNEQAQACLMVALAGIGQQAAALSVFHQVRGGLMDQLGVMPSRVLLDTYEQILRNEIVPDGATLVASER